MAPATEPSKEEGEASKAAPETSAAAGAEEPPPAAADKSESPGEDAEPKEEEAEASEGKPAAAKAEEGEPDQPPAADVPTPKEPQDKEATSAASAADDVKAEGKSPLKEEASPSKTGASPAKKDGKTPSPRKKSNLPVMAHQPTTVHARPPLAVDTSAPPVPPPRRSPVKTEPGAPDAALSGRSADTPSSQKTPSKKPKLPHRSPGGPLGRGPAGSDDEAARTWSETIFPMKLYDILCNPDFHHAVAWMPHGRSWKVLNKDYFMEEICPQYFAQTRYESFIRQVNGWGFKRMRREGPDRSSYYHEHFLRGYPNMIDHMRRPAPGEKSRDLREEPDFYTVPAMPALPPPDPSRANRPYPTNKKVGRPTGSSGRPGAAFDVSRDGLPPTPTGGAGYFMYPPMGPPMSPYGAPPPGQGGPGGPPPFGYPPMGYGYPPPMGPPGYNPYGPPPPGSPWRGPPGQGGPPAGAPGAPPPPGAPQAGPPGYPPQMGYPPYPPMYGDPSQYYAQQQAAAGAPPPGTPQSMTSKRGREGDDTPGSASKRHAPMAHAPPPPGSMPPGSMPPGQPGMPPPGWYYPPPNMGGPTGGMVGHGMPPQGAPGGPPPQQGSQGGDGPYTTL